MARSTWCLVAISFLVALPSAVIGAGCAEADSEYWPLDGQWRGEDIRFQVLNTRQRIRFEYIDYGSCTSGGCTAEESVGGGYIEAAIERDGDIPAFSGEGCVGFFDTEMTAHGTCERPATSCNCTLSSSWTAVFEPDLPEITDERAMVVEPESLDFGDLLPGETAVAEVTILSAGSKDVEVTEVEFEGDWQALRLLTEVGYTVLEPGDTLVLEVEFSPPGHGYFDGEVIIRAPTAQPSRVDVEVEGNGIAPVLEFDPSELSLDDAIVGCLEERLVRVRNTGSATLDVTGAHVASTASEELSLEIEQLEAGLSLEPGEQVDVQLWLLPQDRGGYEATLTLETNDPADEVPTFVASAQAEGNRSTEDEFVQDLDQPISWFALSETNVAPSTIGVHVDGSWDWDWIYEAVSNEVVFSSPPAVGAEILIEYEWGLCM
jgi:hypothetical protein